MKYPRILSVVAIDNHTLLIEFDNNQKKKYDVKPLFKTEMFSAFNNPAFFKAVKVEQGGYAVVWDGKIDISEYELWIHGQPLS